MVINPFDYKDIDYDDYISALEQTPIKETIISIGRSEFLKTEKQLPKVNLDTTCKKFVISNKKEESKKEPKEEIKEKPHEYAKKQEGVSTYHIIKPGETLDSIAKSYNVTVISIMKLNNIKNKYNIKPKQKIKIL